METILLDLDHQSRVATVTLNRPDALNSFNRAMCHEMRDAWHTIKADEGINAVVLRAAGDRAFSAGLDVKSNYGQPEIVWNHE
nr:enoyl-CoA hydratase/isomerase family protein [Streptomyces sp. DSM 41633]